MTYSTNTKASERLVSSPVTIAFIGFATAWLVSSLAIIGYSALLVA